MCFSFCFGRAEFPDMDADFLQEILKVPTSMSIQAGAVLAELSHWEDFFGFFL
jgi:hypothetical protein